MGVSRAARGFGASALVILVVMIAACCREGAGGSGAQGTATVASRAVPSRVEHGTVQESELIRALRDAFQSRNPRLTQVGVLDLKAWDFLGPRLVLGWAIVGDKVFRGSFDDEMFGVFVVNDSLTRVERVVDTFPTRSWFDYEVRFGGFTADSVEVLGRSSTHGDDRTRRLYKWR